MIETYEDFKKIMDELSDLCMNAGSESEMEKFSKQIVEMKQKYSNYFDKWAENLLDEIDDAFKKYMKKD